MRVLLVGENVSVTSSLVTDLTANGVSVEITTTGADALALLRHYEFDLVLLQFVLPDMDGVTLLTRMRLAGRDTPTLVLTVPTQNRYRAKILAAGADDVVEQDVDRVELIARMRAIIRRTRGFSQSRLQVGNLALDIDQQLATANGCPIHLTPKEFSLLQLLVLRKNVVMSKEAILTNLYGGMDEPELKIIDVFICKIRNKLAKAGLPNLIGTAWGRGYVVRDQGRDVLAPTAPPVPAKARQLLVAIAA